MTTILRPRHHRPLSCMESGWALVHRFRCLPQHLRSPHPTHPAFSSRSEALAAVAAPLPIPPVPLALPAYPSCASVRPLPVPGPAAPLSCAPVPLAPAAPLAGLALLPVARPAAPLAGAAPVPVAQPTATVTGAPQLSGPATPAAATAAARGKDAGRARLCQTAQSSCEGRLPGPPQLLGACGGRGLRRRLPSLAAGRGGHAPQASRLRQRALWSR